MAKPWLSGASICASVARASRASRAEGWCISTDRRSKFEVLLEDRAIMAGMDIPVIIHVEASASDDLPSVQVLRWLVEGKEGLCGRESE